MQFKLVENRVAVPQHALVLRAVTLPQRRGKKFIRATADQFAFVAPSATFHQSLIHHHVFAAIVFDEEYQVRQTIEQRLAGEWSGQLRKQFGL